MNPQSCKRTEWTFSSCQSLSSEEPAPLAAEKSSDLCPRAPSVACSCFPRALHTVPVRQRHVNNSAAVGEGHPTLITEIHVSLSHNNVQDMIRGSFHKYTTHHAKTFSILIVCLRVHTSCDALVPLIRWHYDKPLTRRSFGETLSSCTLSYQWALSTCDKVRHSLE